MPSKSTHKADQDTAAAQSPENGAAAGAADTSGTEEDRKTEPGEVQTMMVNNPGGAVNLRKEPGITAEVLAVLNHGAVVVVSGQPSDAGKESWTPVNHEGITGFMMSKYLI